MRLALVSEVRDLIRFDSIDEINDALDTSLLAATAYLSSKLRTTLDRAEDTVEYFYVQDALHIGTSYQTYLALRAGWLDGGETITVAVAPTKKEVDAASARNITSLCMFDYQKGVVHIADEPLSNQYVKVTYTSGFTVTTDHYDNVPSWLKTAAIYQTILDFNRVNPEFRSESGDFKLDLDQAQSYVDEVILGYTKYTPYALDALI